jgi:hypothetical protein
VADRFFATALSSGDNARAPERQWRAATDAWLMSLPRRPDWREQRTTLPPAPTDKPLAPTVDQFWGPATNPSPASGVHVVSYASFRRGTFVCLSLVISLVVVWHPVGGSQPHKCELPPDGCAAWPRRACPERWLPEEGIRKRSRVGRVCAGAGLTSAAWPRGVIVATRTTGAGAAYRRRRVDGVADQSPFLRR